MVKLHHRLAKNLPAVLATFEYHPNHHEMATRTPARNPRGDGRKEDLGPPADVFTTPVT
jgi:hypothetical protein